MARKKSDSVPHKTCMRCNEGKLLSEYYNTHKSIFSPDGKVPMCKKCIKELVDVTDVDSVVDVLRQIDKPFIKNLWEKSQSKVSPFGDYIRMVNSLPQYKEMNFNMTNMEDVNRTVEEQNDPRVIESEFDESDLESLRKKWGKSYTNEDIEYLERYERNMRNDYEITTTSHKDYLMKICRISLQMDKIMIKDPSGFVKLSQVYDKLMDSAKFTNKQRTEADRTGGLDTFGQLFEQIEKRGFIPIWHTEEPQDLVDRTIDNLNNFTRRLVLGETNLSSLVEATVEKMNTSANEEDENKDDVTYEDELSLNRDFEFDDSDEEDDI